jgi:drug/metabolite transporter (DMT)-like permease
MAVVAPFVCVVSAIMIPPMTSRPGRAAVVAVFLLLTLIWGTTWAAIVFSLQGIPPFLGVSLRFLLAGALLVGIALVRGVPLGRSPVERRLWVANGLLSFSASYGLVYWAEQVVPSGLTAVLWATFPLMVAVLAHFALPHERLTLRGVVGVVVGFLGLAVIYSEDLARLGGPRLAFASAVLLLSPLVSAFSNVAIKRWGKGIPPLSLAGPPMLIGGAVMGLLSAWAERGAPVTWGARPVAALLYLAIAGSAVTFSLYYWLLSHTTVVRTSLIAYTTPVVALAIGVLALGEPITARVLAGSLLVVGGVALATA